MAGAFVIKLQVTDLRDVTTFEVRGLCYATEQDGVLEVGCSGSRIKSFFLELGQAPFYSRPI